MVSFNGITYPFTAEQAMARQVKHTIGTLKPQDRNLELKIILLEKTTQFEVKGNQKVTQYLVADHTGSILCNYFGELGTKVQSGDIIYMEGAYVSLFKGNMILYTGKKASIYKIGRFFMPFKEIPRMSDKKYEQKSPDTYIEISQ